MSEPIVIFIYGTSCAGKSSLSQKLKMCLGDRWQLIDRDFILDQHPDEPEVMADDYLIDEIHRLTSENFNVIIDSQSHRNVLEKIGGRYKTISVLVYAPIPLLIERDEKRNKNLNRSERRKFYARAFIFETFAHLYCLSEEKSEKKVGQVHFQELPGDILNYCLDEETSQFFEEIFLTTTSLYLLTREPCDILIQTPQQSIEEAVWQIENYCLN